MHLPWHFAFVMILAVVPLGITVLFLIGILRAALRHRDRAFGFLLLFSALVPIAVVMSGLTKVYDNDRMLMPAFPFLAMLAGSGFGWFVKLLGVLVQRLRIPRFVTPLAAAVVAGLVWIPPVLSLIAYAPYWLSYYSEAVGGLSGARESGLETTYWCESYREAVDYINEHAKPGDSVWVLPSSIDVLVYYQRQGILRKDVLLASVNPLDTIYGASAGVTRAAEDFTQADFVIVQYRQSFLYDESDQPTELLEWTASHQPVMRVEREGVPILDVYVNP
jgi:hypothetical protein